MEQNTSADLFDLHVDHESSSYLGETAKWAKFLAILGFIFCGLFVLGGLFAGSILSGAMGRFGGDSSRISGVALSFIYILGALLYFFPCLYLFNFASKMQVALRNNDQQQMTQSFKNLKSCYKFVGILMIVILAFYALALIITIVGFAGR
jgi:hypothetical protein